MHVATLHQPQPPHLHQLHIHAPQQARLPTTSSPPSPAPLSSQHVPVRRVGLAAAARAAAVAAALPSTNTADVGSRRPRPPPPRHLCSAQAGAAGGLPLRRPARHQRCPRSCAIVATAVKRDAAADATTASTTTTSRRHSTGEKTTAPMCSRTPLPPPLQVIAAPQRRSRAVR